MIDKKAIPTGELASVAGTPFDFLTDKAIGKEIDADDIQLKYAGGYDHNFALDDDGNGVAYAGTLTGEKTGIQMDVYTDCVGMQLYTANFVKGQKGKEGAVYNQRDGVCLETQYFPNAINDSNFVRPITDVGETYESTTIYVFSLA